MPKLIKDNSVIENTWTVAEKDFSGPVEGSEVFLPKAYWLENAAELADRDATGVWLDSDEGPEELQPYLDKLQYIAINFPKFADGRGYSYARLLRERFGYKGEIRAIGDILHDQLFFLQRCGFDTYAIRDDKDAEAAKAGLSDFTNNYQAACDDDRPLYRRRG